jgi:STE24 endopeptidase
MNTSILFYGVIGVMGMMLVVNIIFSMLNFANRKKPLPRNVATIYSVEQYAKWQAYFTEKTRATLIKNIVNFILLVVLFLTNFFVIVHTWATTITTNDFFVSVLFVSVLTIGNALLQLPFKYYDTFSIETRYGFNKSTKKTFVIDTIKSMVLGSLFVGSIAGLLATLYNLFSTQFVVVAWGTLSVLMIVLFMLNTKVFIKVFNKLSPLPDGDLKDQLLTLAQKTGFKAKAIYVMDASKRSSKLNAFFSGFGPIREIALFDTLVQKLTPDEVTAVLAHEIGHAKHFDEIRLIVQQIVIFGLYAFILNFIVSNVDLALAFGFETPFFTFGLLLFTFLTEPLDFLINIPTNYLSRRAEFAADAFAVKQGYKDAMLSALQKLVTENFGNLNPHPAVVLLSYTHPPMHIRLAAIEKLN